MESKNFAKIIETPKRDFTVDKINSGKETGVCIATVVEGGHSAYVFIKTEKEADNQGLFDSIDAKNVETEFEERFKESEEPGSEEEE